MGTWLKFSAVWMELAKVGILPSISDVIESLAKKGGHETEIKVLKTLEDLNNALETGSDAAEAGKDAMESGKNVKPSQLKQSNLATPAPSDSPYKNTPIGTIVHWRGDAPGDNIQTTDHNFGATCCQTAPATDTFPKN